MKIDKPIFNHSICIAIFSLTTFALASQKIIVPNETSGKFRNSDEIRYYKLDIDVPHVVCPFSYEINDIYVPYNKNRRPKSFVPISNFVATYQNFPPEAEEAFEFALGILEEIIPTPIQINVLAQFDQLDGGTLASARATGFFTVTGGGLPDNTIFPIALAEKLSAENLNETDFDLGVSIDERTNWYYDFNNPTDINGQFDFVSVVLHEMLHGLGFLSFTAVEGSLGGIGLQGGIHLLYDRFLEDGEGRSLIEDIPNGSFELGSLLRGNDLFFGSAFFTINSPNDLPKIYSPPGFNPTSSISHIDQLLYFRTENSLMTPTTTLNEVIHDPGIALDMLYDIGWNRTSIFLQHDFFTEDVNEDAEFVVQVLSDFPFDTSTLQLFHFEGDFNFLNLNRVPLESTGQDNLFRAVVAAPGEDKMINFYYSVRDGRNISVSNPFGAPNQFFRFSWGTDQILPVISHIPVTSINENESSVFISCIISDEFTGVERAFVHYNVEGKTSGTEDMVPRVGQFGEVLFEAEINVGTIDTNDIIEYRIVAVDRSSNANEGVLPESGFFEVNVNALARPISQYVSDFDDLVDDFVGEGFSVRLEDGFSNPALHSTHPYGHAATLGLSSFDLTYELKFSVIVAADNAEITYDEIVLLEPGELNVPFGQAEFWDYVIVEAKFFEGTEWLPLLAGYDSRAQGNWNNDYLSSFSTCPEVSAIPECISDIAGDESMFRSRRIDLNINEDINTGDTIFIRFRLFSDPEAFGWGWAIDNLSIQGLRITTPVEEVELVNLFDIRPNPVRDDQVQIVLNFEELKPSLNIGIRDITGRSLYSNNVSTNTKNLKLHINTASYPAGIYFVTISDSKGITTKKMMVTR